MTERTAVVVGGGIGGLAAALALRIRGWQVQVLERRAGISEVGAGITLWPNALRALDALGLGARIRSVGLAQVTGGIRDQHGHWLSRTDTTAVAERFGDGIVVLDRGELLGVLRDAVPAAAIRTSAEVTGVTRNGVVTVAGGADTERFTADLVVAADGLRSTVRTALWPAGGRTRAEGIVAWRFTCRLPLGVPADGGESWGRGQYAGFAPLPDGRIYAWFATAAAGAPTEPASTLVWLYRRFAAWHSPIPELLQAASPDQLLRHEIHDLEPLDTFVLGRVALLGDAAHAMTPNLGQGACQALEDAVELAAAVGPGAVPETVDNGSGDIGTGLAAYDAHRRPRAQRIAARSRAAGRVAALQAPAAVGLRNAVVGLIPSAVALRGLDDVLDWHPADLRP